jgi:hypothetical protein
MSRTKHATNTTFFLSLSVPRSVMGKPSARRRSSPDGGLAERNKNRTYPEAEPASIGGDRQIIAPHPYIRRISTDPNHDADIRISSEAPKQQVPNLDNGTKAIGVREQPATSDRLWQIVAYKRRLAKTCVFGFFYCRLSFCRCLCRGPQLEAFGH